MDTRRLWLRATPTQHNPGRGIAPPSACSAVRLSAGKNHYGSRSRRGTEVAAILYSLVESAKLNGLDPRDYLRTAVHAALRGEQIPLPHELVVAA